MPYLNMDAVMAKVRAFASSDAGQKMMDARLAEYRSGNVSRTAAGDRVLGEDDMYEAASKMIQVLRSTARDFGLAPSVLALFDTLDHSRIIKFPNGTSEIFIYFTGDTHRESLYPEGYEGGVDNIVALLNNGYHASGYVYGWWDGHQDYAGGHTDLRNAGMESSVWIRSRKDFDGYHFIQQAVQDFNGNYGSDYNVTAVAGAAYT